MKKCLLLFFILPMFACEDTTETGADLGKSIPDTSESARASHYEAFDNDRDALSYALGADQGHGLLRRAQYLKSIGVDLSNDLTRQGFLDAFADAEKSDSDPKTQKLDKEEMKTLIYAFSREQQKIEQALAQKEAKEHAIKGNAFLKENKKKKDIIVTESGLQYRVLSSGSGLKPTLNDIILAHYTGRYIDGREFDSSRSRGSEPTKFIVSQVIAGWTEALLMMRVGDTWEIVLPPSIAYGESRHGDIPANSVLVFEIELIDIAANKNKF